MFNMDFVKVYHVELNWWRQLTTLQTLNEGQQVDSILLDFRKAFDVVSHWKLLLKLHHYGIWAKKSYMDWKLEKLDSASSCWRCDILSSDILSKLHLVCHRVVC